ncbi:MAG: histidine kinase [Anaerolineae bacterium]|nr:histidine kinase [Anaerolineae bacterium]
MRRPQWLKMGAFFLTSVDVGLALLVVLLVALNGETSTRAMSSLVELPPSLSFSLVGVLIIARRPDHIIGWLLLLIGLPLVLEQFGLQYATYTFLTQPGSLPGGDFVIWLTFGVWGLSYGGVALLTLLFPTGRPLSPRWGWVGWLTVGAAGMWLILTLIALWPYRGPLLLEETAPPGLEGVQGVGLGLLNLITLAFLAAVVSAIMRLRRSSGVERQQLKWFVYAVSLTIVVMLMLTVLVNFVPELVGETGQNLANLAYSFAFSAIPVAIGMAILRYRLWDIDLIIHRTLVYGSLTASVAALYILVVGGLGALFQTRGNLFISILATGLVAVLFAPLRDRLQRGVNRLLYGERDDPYAVLSRLGRQLENTLAPNEVLPTIVATLKEAFKLPYAAVALDQAEENTLAAAAGTPTPQPFCLPLTYQGEQLGHLLLGARAPDQAFTPAEQRLLNDLARQVGVALAAVRLTTDLQRSRQRLVTARAEERRRLRRDLHDGLGPQLASHALKLEAARDLIRTNPERAETLLNNLIEKSQGIVSEVRRLVYDLRPPALDELGLVGAIREYVAQSGVNGLQITLDAPERLPTLPAAVEVAAYRIIQEAVTNTIRHARARTCRVSLTLTDEPAALDLEICDDGLGLPAAYHAGVGLASMRERAQELGGKCEVEMATNGGVRVLAHLPLPQE